MSVSDNIFHVVRYPDSLLKTVRNTAAFNLNRLMTVTEARRMNQRLTCIEHQKQVEEFNSRNVVFTVTAGRTGTDTLSKVCNLPQTTVSEHEPMPHYRYYLGLVQKDPPLATAIFCHLKVPAILDISAPSYVETTHLFCKGFLEPCLAYGFRPSLIFLKRQARAIAVSLLRKNAIPGRTGVGYRHLISPKDNCYLQLDERVNYSDYELCYWYCLETELRQELYFQLANEYGLKHFTIETADLSNPNLCMDMFRTLDLASQKEINDVALPKWKASINNESKNIISLDIDFEKSESKVENACTVSMSIERLVDTLSQISMQVPKV